MLLCRVGGPEILGADLASNVLLGLDLVVVEGDPGGEGLLAQLTGGDIT